MGRLIRAYWKDNLGVDLEVRERNVIHSSQRRLGFVSGVDLEAHELYTRVCGGTTFEFLSHHRGIVELPIRLRSSAACHRVTSIYDIVYGPPESSPPPGYRQSFLLCSTTLIRFL